MKIKNLIIRIRRILNKHKLYSYPDCNDGWIKFSQIIKGTKDESFFDPYVLEDDDDIKLYVSNRKTNSIFCYILDKDSLKIKEFFESFNSLGSWKTKVSRACVLKFKSKYYMWYTGQTEQFSKIGIAISNDGKYFKELLDVPVVYPSFGYEGTSVMNPCVIYDEDINKFKMWYSAGQLYEPDVICYAESDDGIIWKKYISPVLIKGKENYHRFKIGGCDIIKSKDTYIMYYIGYETIDIARICVAFSVDGIKWTICDRNPIISPSKDEWDSDACYKPAYLFDSNTEYLFYNGRKKGIESIGVAIRKRK